jgi:HlyD family secretion protein
VAVARARRADFIISVNVRGDIRSPRSTILKAPSAPGLRITHLVQNGIPVKKGEVVVEFDPVTQEQNVITQTTQVISVHGDIEQMKATQVMNDDGADAMNKMQAEYGVESAKLDASKAEVLSQVDGAKNRIQVGVVEGIVAAGQGHHERAPGGKQSPTSPGPTSEDKASRDLEPATATCP